MTRFPGLALVAIVFLAGCAGGGGAALDTPSPAAQPRARDVALPEVRVAGGEHQLALTLGARVTPAPGATQPQLRVEIRYAGATRTYDTARDGQGSILRAERTSGGACTAGAACVETLSIELPDAALRQARSTGFRLKLFARKGPEIEIGIPGGQIGALYERIDGAAAPRTAARKGA